MLIKIIFIDTIEISTFVSNGGCDTNSISYEILNCDFSFSFARNLDIIEIGG